MSLHDYKVSLELERSGVPFYALVMAAMRRADTDNLRKLQRAFPEAWDELQKRYDSPGGMLWSERDWAAFEAPRRATATETS